MSRQLYIVPIIHTSEDFGSLRNEVVQMAVQLRGENGYANFLEQVESYWVKVEKRLQDAGLFEPNVVDKVYVDGLVNVEEHVVDKIVRDLIEQNLRVYQLVKKFQESGSEIVGTESPELLLQEYQYWKDVISDEICVLNPTKEIELLRGRDIAIAFRIDETLGRNETGVLFAGSMHRVEDYLFQDIGVVRL